MKVRSFSLDEETETILLTHANGDGHGLSDALRELVRAGDNNLRRLQWRVKRAIERAKQETTVEAALKVVEEALG